jgi:hypothetical protein
MNTFYWSLQALINYVISFFIADLPYRRSANCVQPYCTRRCERKLDIRGARKASEVVKEESLSIRDAAKTIIPERKIRNE